LSLSRFGGKATETPLTCWIKTISAEWTARCKKPLLYPLSYGGPAAEYPPFALSYDAAAGAGSLLSPPDRKHDWEQNHSLPSRRAERDSTDDPQAAQRERRTLIRPDNMQLGAASWRAGT
jgi:hypothetical protein